VLHIEALGLLRECMDQNRANTCDFGGLNGAKNSISEERRADSTALKSRRNGEPSDDDDGHWIRHIPLDPSRRFCVRDGSGCQSIVSGDFRPRTQKIRSGGAALFVL
jgi:hypothetical protein